MPQKRNIDPSAQTHADETKLPDGRFPPRLNRQEAAQFLTDAGLRIAATTLAKKAVDGSGPPFRIGNGRAVYEVADLVYGQRSGSGRNIAPPQSARARDEARHLPYSGPRDETSARP